MTKYELTLYTQHHSFYVIDQEKETEAMLALAKAKERVFSQGITAIPNHLIVVQTARWGTSKVVVEIRTKPPTDSAAWDHIVEASINLSSGHLLVWDMLPEQADPIIPVEPVWHRARIHMGDLASVTDPDGDGDDQYLVALWPAPPTDTVILKQYEPWLAFDSVA